MTNEENRRNKDAAWLLTHPRELCKHCSEWHECEDTVYDDMSGCAAAIQPYNNYLLGWSDTCEHFFED